MNTSRGNSDPTSSPYASRMLSLKSPGPDVPSYAKHTIASARGTERRFQYTHQKPEPVTPLKQSGSTKEEQQNSNCSDQNHSHHNHDAPDFPDSASATVAPTSSSSLDDSPVQRKCVCGICTCGRHHCPARVHLVPYDKDALDSSYRKSFVPHEMQRTATTAQARPVNFGGWDADQFSTVSRQTYLPYDSSTLHEVHKHRMSYLNSVQPSPRARGVPFTAKSEYDQQFTPKSPEKPSRPLTAPSSRRSEYDPLSGPREFSPHTTHRDEFRAWQLQKNTPSPRDQAQSYSPSHYDPADLNSTYSSNYKAPPDGFRVKRQLAPTFSSDPNDINPSVRELSTTHRVEFSPKPLNLCPSVFLQPKDDIASDPTGHVFYEFHDGKWV